MGIIFGKSQAERQRERQHQREEQEKKQRAARQVQNQKRRQEQAWRQYELSKAFQLAKKNFDRIGKEEKRQRKQLVSVRTDNHNQLVELEKKKTDLFIQKISRSFDVMNPVKQNEGEFNIILLGESSTGKSAFLNLQFDLQLQTSPFHSEKSKGQEVMKTNGVKVFEVSISNFDLDFYEDDLENIRCLKNATKVIVFYEGALKSHKTIVMLAYRVNTVGRKYMVRTKADLFQPDQDRTLDAELKIDRQQLENWKIKEPELFAISSLEKDKFDNAKVKRILSQK